jgi:hypothetical protein
MVFGTIFLAALDLTTILNDWANAGVFSYVLPFLLVFAFVYGLLSKVKVFGDDAKGVNIVIALAVGGLSLVGDFVPNFFQTIFPYTGIGLSILLVAVILGALVFNDVEKTGVSVAIRWTLFIVGAIIFIVVIYTSLSDYNFVGSDFWNEYGSTFIVLALIIGAIAWISADKKDPAAKVKEAGKF